MILIVTNEKDYTADYLILELHRRGIPFFRFNTERFPSKTSVTIRVAGNGSEGEIRSGDRCIALDEVTSVWYRRPVPCEPPETITDPFARKYVEAESTALVTGLRYLLDSFWVSHPDNLRIAESKLHQLRVASAIGMTIPETLVTNRPDDALRFYEGQAGGVICKPQEFNQLVRDDSVGLIYTNFVRPKHAKEFDKIEYSPTLFQPCIPKQIELRVTVVGTQVFAVALHSQEVLEARDDWRRANPDELSYELHSLPHDVSQCCVQLVQTLGLSFGAIDMIVTPEGRYVFLEINPNGQWAWLEFVCPNVSIRSALVDLLVESGQTDG